MASALPVIGSLIGPAMGIIGQIAKGKKTKYSTNQTPEQAGQYTDMLNMLRQKNQSGGSGVNQDMMNMLYSMFLKRPLNPQGQTPLQQPQQGIPSYRPNMNYGNAR